MKNNDLNDSKNSLNIFYINPIKKLKLKKFIKLLFVNSSILCNKINKKKNHKSPSPQNYKAIIILTLILLIYIIKTNNTNNYLNLYIVTHKDFNNTLNNPYYKLICDEKSQLKYLYKIEIIETNKNNDLHQIKRGYCEGSKIYYIWKNYMEKKISSKYVGFCHYNRVFHFKNNIPNLDKIFSKYDAIINKRSPLVETMKEQYSRFHMGPLLDEIEVIIKENFTEFYSTAIKSLNKHYISCCNIFIMKKNDFLKYGEFVFGVLLEFDRRHKIKNDNDLQIFLESEGKKMGNKICVPCQDRQEGYLMERISNIFYDYQFTNALEMIIQPQIIN